MKFVKNNKKLIQITGLIVVLILFCLYAFYNRAEFRRLAEIKISDALLIVLGQLTVLLSAGLMLREIIVRHGKTCSSLEIAEVTAYSSLVNFFGFLQGGVGVRAIYTKTRHKINYKAFLGFTFLQYLSLFYISFTLITVSVIDVALGPLLKILLIISVLVPLFIITPTLLKRITNNITYSSKLNGLAKYSLRNISIINLVQIGGCIIIYGAALHSIGATISIEGLLIYTAIAQFSLVFAITPGAIGVREALLLIASSKMGVSLNDIVLASTLERLLLFITFALITPLAMVVRKNKEEIVGINKENKEEMEQKNEISSKILN